MKNIFQNIHAAAKQHGLSCTAHMRLLSMARKYPLELEQGVTADNIRKVLSFPIKQPWGGVLYFKNVQDIHTGEQTTLFLPLD